ncbi:MAG: ABC transporter substrate-binding protein [Hyphomicrobiales bacterium]
MKRKFSPMAASRRQFLAGTGAVAAGLTLAPYKSFAADEKKVNLYNWDTYIGENTLSDFNKATGIEAKMDLFADNDELFAKLKEGNPGYDVIVPTNDYVERMIVAKMLEPLDHSKIPNMSNIAKAFQDAAFDPGRKHSIPYMWGTIALGYRKSKVGDTPPDSWKVCYDDDKFAGKVSLLGDADNVIGHALKYLGHSLNTTDEKQINEAAELIIANKKNIKVFADDNGQDLLASGEVDIAQEWNGDILQVMEEDDDITLTVPKEGGLLWQDCMCIPTGAPNPENAHALINYILDAKAGAEIAEFISYATPNEAAKKLTSKEYQENTAIFPSDDTLAKCEAAIYKGPEVTKLFQDAWTRVNAA